jgi:hypothetical protein
MLKCGMGNQPLMYTNGDTYFGQISTFQGIVLPHGYGTLTKPTGDTHVGTFYEGRRQGQGQSFIVSSQRLYNGEFNCDREEGYAIITFPGTLGTQRQYSGYIMNGQRHGYGKQVEVLATGRTTLYEGDWACDQLNGRGKFIIMEGAVTHCYEGNFVNGRLEGWGTYSGTPLNVRYNVWFQGGIVTSWGLQI